MSTIVVITHRHDRFIEPGPAPSGYHSDYMLADIVMELKRRKHRIVVARGVPDGPVNGDAAILHVDATVTAAEYAEFARTFPYCLNLRVTDISKRTVSGAVLGRDEPWAGPVIVKSNLNWGGRPEARLNEIAQQNGEPAPFPGARTVTSYATYDSVGLVPGEAFKDPNLVVEKFVPETEADGYAARFWVFCGSQERCNRYVSPERVLKGANVVRREPVPVPDDLRLIRSKLGFDYGKFDFVVHDGRAILLDANKTLGRPRHLGKKLAREVVRFADGFERLIPR